MRIGCDPEVFLLQNNYYKSVIGMIGRGKLDPLPVEGMEEGFTFQEDNVALEFGVPPAASEERFVFNVKAVQEEFLKQHPGFAFSSVSCVEFPQSELEHPMSQIFGCEPDYNAWTGRKNKSPQPPNPFMRSAGGHIHVETELDKRLVIRALDLTIGVPSVLMDNGEQRRLIYGKAGAFRPKSYGVEYRTPSNFWIFEDRKVRWVWRNVERALKMVESGMAEELIQIKKEITNTIDKGNKAGAKLLVKAFDLEVV